jgi:hypothetical protein
MIDLAVQMAADEELDRLANLQPARPGKGIGCPL